VCASLFQDRDNIRRESLGSSRIRGLGKCIVIVLRLKS
jgi:hypothetical protein